MLTHDNLGHLPEHCTQGLLVSNTTGEKPDGVVNLDTRRCTVRDTMEDKQRPF